jgi:SAM-dependent methyltransferase
MNARASLYDFADLYDRITVPAVREAGFYTKLAKKHGRTLELGCGTGRLTAALHAEGVDITGLDTSEAMLERARQKCPDVRFVRGDMRDLDLGERYGLIFVALNSLLHLHTLDDFRRFFDGVRRHLEPGGVLAFDIFVPSFQVLGRDPNERHELARMEDPASGAEIVIEEKTDYDARTQVTHTTWHVHVGEERDAHVMAFALRNLFPHELLALVDGMGFEVTARRSGFYNQPFVRHSQLQVVVARPKAVAVEAAA